MDEKRKEWNKQYTSNIDVKEFLRLGCAIIIWILIGVVISVAVTLSGYATGSIIFGIFFIMIPVFPFIAFSWKPAYRLLRRILGNNNLPLELMPRSIIKIPRQPRPWYSYLPGIWGLLMVLLLLYIILNR